MFDMSTSGTIFKVTAQNCKEWADLANNDGYERLLEVVANAARNGNYSVVIDKISPDSKSKLSDAGFLVVKCFNGWRVHWQ